MADTNEIKIADVGTNRFGPMTPNERFLVGAKLDYHLDGIKVPGLRGSWHTVDDKWICGVRFWLLEEDSEGDNWPCLIVGPYGELVNGDAPNGFGDLQEQIDNSEVFVLNGHAYMKVTEG